MKTFYSAEIKRLLESAPHPGLEIKVEQFDDRLEIVLNRDNFSTFSDRQQQDLVQWLLATKTKINNMGIPLGLRRD